MKKMCDYKIDDLKELDFIKKIVERVDFTLTKIASKDKNSPETSKGEASNLTDVHHLNEMIHSSRTLEALQLERSYYQGFMVGSAWKDAVISSMHSSSPSFRISHPGNPLQFRGYNWPLPVTAVCMCNTLLKVVLYLFFTAVVTKGFGLNHPGISRFEKPSRVLAIESNQPPQQRVDTPLFVSSQNDQYHTNQVQNSSSRHVASTSTPKRSLLAFAPPDNPLGVVADDTSSTIVVASNVATDTSTSPVEAKPATPPVTTTTTASLNAETPLVFGSSTNLVTLSAPKSNSLTNEVEGNISGSTFAALDTGSRFEKGEISQRTRGGRLTKPTKKS
ncbi:hypothetical protein Bca52824_090802 [Brassica carinata]|uniref:Uncharacterized protein n=1 Tax=Brassica carinata TaxID=52824 RepID=A0A8X7NX52_BRACI|nr:hypothetical protein Bca52824_090802 [Brassica carinata]